MGAIAYRTFAEGSKPYLTLAGEELVRPLGVGSNWTTLRIVVQCGVTQNGTSNITGVNLAFGLCSGTARPYGSGNCLNGLYPLFTASTDTYAYTTNGGYSFYYSSATNCAKVVNGVATTGGGATATLPLAGSRRGVFIMTFSKGSPNFGCSIAYVGSGSGVQYQYDQTMRHAVEWCDTTSTGSPSITLNDLTTNLTGNTNTLAFNESAGPLDTLNLYWNKSQFPLEIYGIFVQRQA